MQNQDTLNTKQSEPGIEVTREMCLMGAHAYMGWLADVYEQKKLNSVANVAAQIYRAMEEERRLSA